MINAAPIRLYLSIFFYFNIYFYRKDELKSYNLAELPALRVFVMIVTYAEYDGCFINIELMHENSKIVVSCRLGKRYISNLYKDNESLALRDLMMQDNVASLVAKRCRLSPLLIKKAFVIYALKAL